jgi:SAM-dependent methyltransferase
VVGGVLTKTIESGRDWHAYWNLVSGRSGPEEFFRQVERTIGGRPTGPDQIELAVSAARSALDLNSSDCLLDLCCGNGLLTIQLAAACRFTYGVDFSRDLVEIARRHHAGAAVRYIHCPVTELNATRLDRYRPTKVCMIGALQFFTPETLERLLAVLRALTGGLAPINFLDVPDVDRLYNFYDTPDRRIDYQLRRAVGTEAIGTWWSRRHLADLLDSHGLRGGISAPKSALLGGALPLRHAGQTEC